MAQRKNAKITMQSFMDSITSPTLAGGEDGADLQGQLVRAVQSWAGDTDEDTNRFQLNARRFMRIMQGYLPGIPENQPQIQLRPGIRRDLIAQSVATEDFPDIFGTIIHRRLLSMFEISPPQARQLCQTAACGDFRIIELYNITGGRERLTLVGKEDIPRASDRMANTKFSYKMEVYAKNFNWNWRDLVDDQGDLRIFDRIPRLMFEAARETEEVFILSNLVATGLNGWSTALWTANSTTKVVAPQTNACGLQAIRDNAKLMRKYRTEDGKPFRARPRILAVDGSAEYDGLDFLSTKVVRKDSGSAGFYNTDSPIQMLNIKLLTLDYLSFVATGAKGPTMWGLFMDPSDPAVPTAIFEFGQFRGFETPQLYKKDNDRRSMSGAPIGAMGDFTNMEETIQIVYPMGGTTLFAQNGVVSDGS